MNKFITSAILAALLFLSVSACGIKERIEKARETDRERPSAIITETDAPGDPGDPGDTANSDAPGDPGEAEPLDGYRHIVLYPIDVAGIHGKIPIIANVDEDYRETSWGAMLHCFFGFVDMKISVFDSSTRGEIATADAMRAYLQGRAASSASDVDGVATELVVSVEESGGGVTGYAAWFELAHGLIARDTFRIRYARFVDDVAAYYEISVPYIEGIQNDTAEEIADEIIGFFDLREAYEKSWQDAVELKDTSAEPRGPVLRTDG
jgi:hypothetical protein